MAGGFGRENVLTRIPNPTDAQGLSVLSGDAVDDCISGRPVIVNATYQGQTTGSQGIWMFGDNFLTVKLSNLHDLRITILDQDQNPIEGVRIIGTSSTNLRAGLSETTNKAGQTVFKQIPLNSDYLLTFKNGNEEKSQTERLEDAEAYLEGIGALRFLRRYCGELNRREQLDVFKCALTHSCAVDILEYAIELWESDNPEDLDGMLNNLLRRIGRRIEKYWYLETKLPYPTDECRLEYSKLELLLGVTDAVMIKTAVEEFNQKNQERKVREFNEANELADSDSALYGEIIEAQIKGSLEDWMTIQNKIKQKILENQLKEAFRLARKNR